MFAVERRPTAAPPPPAHDRARREGSGGGTTPPPPGWIALATRVPPASAASEPKPAPAPPAPAPTPPAAAKPAADGPVPVLSGGSVTVEDRGHERLGKAEGNVGALSKHDVRSDFTVSASHAYITDPPDYKWEYGLVQNLLFDHVYIKYSKGDMLVDVVGPLLDIWPTDRPPFFHDGPTNPVLARAGLFTLSAAQPDFTDHPELPLGPTATHCGETVTLQSAERSMLFRVGLVARHRTRGTLVQLGAIETPYLIAWRLGNVNYGAGTSELKSLNQAAGTYPLARPGPPLALTPPTAVEKINPANTAEKQAMEQRCENLL